MHSFLIDTEFLGFPLVIPTSVVFSLAAILGGGLLFILLLPEKATRGSHLLFGAVAVAAALVGARLLQFTLELFIFPDRNPLFGFVESGSTVIGGILGGGLASLVYKKFQRGGSVTWRTFDAAAVAFTAGDALLRLGCYFTGCCFGQVCASSPFAITYPPDWIMHRFFNLDIPFGPRLPFPFIAAAALAVIALVLFIIFRRGKFQGEAASLFFILYGVYRFSIEFIRDEPFRLFIGPLSFAQWFGLACLPVGILLLRRARLKKEPVSSPPEI